MQMVSRVIAALVLLLTATLAAAPALAQVSNYSFQTLGPTPSPPTLGLFSLSFSGSAYTLTDYNSAASNGYVYTIANTGSQPNGVEFVIGGTLNGVATAIPNTDDFYFSFDPSLASSMSTYNYTTAQGAFEAVPMLITRQAPAPEPETWLLMILGFGAIGAVLRRRRRIAVCGTGRYHPTTPWRATTQ